MRRPVTLPPRYADELEPIGSGGFGSVYRGQNLVLDRPVAVKVPFARLDRDVARELSLELQAAARLPLDHPSAPLGREPRLSGIAVECGLERLTVELHLHDMALEMPRAETPAGCITFGLAAARRRQNRRGPMRSV